MKKKSIYKFLVLISIIAFTIIAFSKDFVKESDNLEGENILIPPPSLVPAGDI